MNKFYLSKKKIPINDRLIVSLDLNSIEKAKKLVNELASTVNFYKIGLELLMTKDYFTLIDYLSKKNKKIFADLKLFDIPETIYRSVKQFENVKIDFITVHGNDSMLEAAVKAKKNFKILAVTALTSLDQLDLKSLGFKCNIEKLVFSRAKKALEIGCDGIISSGLEIKSLRQKLNSKLIVVTPGIRPVENKLNDQKRVVNIKTAFENGADYIVIGRPIKNAKSPLKAAEIIQQEIYKIFTK